MARPKALATPVGSGPVLGTPPTLEWVAAERLSVDPDYQRSTAGEHSRKIIFGMVKAWDWALCQPLVVSRRADGSLFVLDGQHRLAGARERGDIPHLPCVLQHGQDPAGEAAAFVALNTRRQKLSQGDIFNGMLAAGDADAKAMAALLGETGWMQARSQINLASSPGLLMCAPTLVKRLRADGEAAVRNALTALREAYPDRPVPNSATLLNALVCIYRDGDLDGIDPDLFIETMGEIEPGDWDDFGREERRNSPVLSRIEGLALAMVNACREAAKGIG